MKVLTACFQYNYGDVSRGESLEKIAFYPAWQKLVDEVIPFWLEDHGFPNQSDDLQQALLSAVEAHKPDLVFLMLMDKEIQVATLEKLKQTCIVINWFGDDQWRFERFSRYIAPHLTYAITTDKYAVPKYESLDSCGVIASQWATFAYQDNLSLDGEYQYAVSFVGGKNIVRAWMIDMLARHGIEVACFGVGWPNGAVTTESMQEIFLKSKINLNLSNSIPRHAGFWKYALKRACCGNIEAIKLWLKVLLGQSKRLKGQEQIKARNFEISGCGGFQLSQYAVSLEDYYNIGEELAVFVQPEDVVLQIQYYLHHEQQREAMKRRAYDKTKLHTYWHRIKGILAQVKR